MRCSNNNCKNEAIGELPVYGLDSYQSFCVGCGQTQILQVWQDVQRMIEAANNFTAELKELDSRAFQDYCCGKMYKACHICDNDE